MKKVIELGKEYLKLESQIRDEIENLNESSIAIHELSDEERNIIYELLKRFDVNLFGVLLKSEKNKKFAIEYLKKYYLDGDNLYNNVKYQSGIDILLDDYYEIEGDAKLKELVLTISKENRMHPEIVRAIRFIYDLDDDENLPSWFEN